MGDMADYYREQEIWMDEFQRDDEITRDSIWRTAAGKRIAVKDLKDSHLLNIIRCFRNMSPHGTKVFPTDPVQRRLWVNVLSNEAYHRGLSLEELTENEPVHE